MAQLLAPEDQQLVVRLLVKLHRRLHGAVDTWSLLCLQPVSPQADARAFVAQHGDVLRSLAVVIRSVLAEAGHDESGAEELLAACQRLQGAFAVFTGGSSVSSQEVRDATETLRGSYRQLLWAIAQLGETLGCQEMPWQQRTPELDEYYDRILDNLFDLFERAQKADCPPASAAAVR